MTREVTVVRAPPAAIHRAARGLASLAGAVGLAMLLPAAILAIGIPVAILARAIGEAIVWLLM